MHFKTLLWGLTTYATLGSFVHAVHFTRIYGVAEKDLGKYQKTPDGLFHCLDGTQVIPYTALNDDYCDCDDGSDEPGTAACINSKFYCDNNGSVGNYIPSSRVNDGVCDYELCCDGSDEYNGIVQCPDRCEEIAKKEERKRKKKVRELYQAFQLHHTMIMKALGNMTFDVLTIENKKMEMNEENENLEKIKVQIKELEAVERDTKDFYKVLYRELRKELHLTKDRLRQVTEDLLKIKNSKGQDPDDPATEKMILDQYSEDLLRELEPQPDPSEQPDNVDKEEEEEKRRIEELEKAYQKVKSELTALRVKKNEIDRNAKSIKREIDELNKKMDMDHGKDHVFYTLFGTTYTLNTTDYIYTFVWGSEIKQKQQKGALTLLGKFKEFSEDHRTIIYDNGAQCWNGPKRKVIVKLICAPRNGIVRVTEPNKCEYELEFHTPGVCDDEDIRFITECNGSEEESGFSDELLRSIRDMMNENPAPRILEEEELETEVVETEDEEEKAEDEGLTMEEEGEAEALKHDEL